MDVRCEHCRTEYEFDDAKITETGVTVKCTVCNHVFKVKKKALVVTEPVKLDEVDNPLATPSSLGDDRPRDREWKVRQASGNVFSFKELTTLQKWIVERKVSRDDEISLTGEAWKRLGNIAELASFFQVVEAADRAAAYVPQPSQPVMYAPSFTPNPQPAFTQYPAYPVPPTQSAGPGPGPLPIPVQSPSISGEIRLPAQPDRGPSMLGPPIRDDEPDDDEIAAIRGGRTKYIVGALVLGVLVGAGAYFKATTGSFNPFAKAEVKPPEPTPPAPTPPTPPEVKPDDKTAAKPDDKTAAKPDDKAAAKPDDKTAAKPDDKAAAKPDDKTAAKPDDKTAAKPDDKTAAKPDDKTAAKPDDKTAAKPDDKTAAKPDDKTAAKPPETGVPSGKGYDFYIQSADRLRNRNQASLALQYYEKAIEEQPGTAEPIAGKAFCLVDLDRHDEAITLFRKALEIYPRYLPAIMGLAEAYKEKGDKKQALEYYTRYVDQAPDGPEAGIARAAIEKLNKE